MKFTHFWCLNIFFIGTLFSNFSILHAQNIPNLDNDFYYMLDYPVNIRAQPNLQGTVIGRLNLRDRIEILENMFNEQEINNVWAFWYRIRFMDREGFIWGGNIAKNTFIFDIDGNGQNDFFQFRYSRPDGNVRWHLNMSTDIFIYINGRRISNEFFSLEEDRLYWTSAYFRQVNNNVELFLRASIGNPINRIYNTSFEIDAVGVIHLVERYGEDYESEL